MWYFMRNKWNQVWLLLLVSVVAVVVPGCNLFTGTGTEARVVIHDGDGATGYVVSRPVGIDCGMVCAESFRFGSRLVLLAEADTNSLFLGWSGDCNETEPRCVLNMTTDRTVYARFGPGFQVRVTKSGGGTGLVMASPDGIYCGDVCEWGYSKDARVALSAEPTGGSLFVGWDGACSGTNRRCTVNVTEPLEVEAIFRAGHWLWLDRTGDGSGTIISTPRGIDCGRICVNSFPEGTWVVLTAFPDAQSSFAGWSGDCEGSSTSCLVEISDERRVTAEFSR